MIRIIHRRITKHTTGTQQVVKFPDIIHRDSSGCEYKSSIHVAGKNVTVYSIFPKNRLSVTTRAFTRGWQINQGIPHRVNYFTDTQAFYCRIIVYPA